MGKAVKAIAGIVLTVVGVATGQPWLVKLGTQLILAGLVDILTPKPRTAGNPGIQVEYTGGVESRRIVYGQMRMSGMNVIEPITTGASNKFLHQILTAAGHEVDSIPNVYLANTDIPAASIGAVTGTTSDGAVTTGDYANVVWIRRYLGTSTQTADFILRNAVPSLWTTNHRGRGVAYLAFQYQFDTDKYPNGKPPAEFLVKGKKVYDPRLDSTNGGSGTQRYTDSTTWTWSANPALCLVDYITDNRVGMGEAFTRIDWPLVITAANICDELVNLPGSTTQKRYTCNVVLDATDDYKENISILAAAMLGHCYYRAGKWQIHAGAWTASAFSLGADDFTGTFKLTTEIPRREKYNAVRCQILDASQNYRQTEAPAALNATYETDDGNERIWKEIQLSACVDKYEAQRACIIVNRMGRAKKTVTCEALLSAYKIRPFETGTVTLAEVGWTNQPVRCLSWKFLPTGKIQLTLKEASSTEWSDPLTTDYGSPASPTSSTPTKFSPSAANNFTATPIVDGILFAWDLPDIVIPGTTYTIYEHTAATPFSSAVAVATGLTGTSKTIPKADTTTRYYWVVARGPSGGLSAETPSGSGVAGKALSITTGFRATATPGSRTKTGSTSSLTTLSVTVAPVNGTAPYTYAWTTVSGGTIAITSSTSATTTFSATGLADPETRTGVKRCTITDNLGATATVDVNLQFTRDSSLYL